LKEEVQKEAQEEMQEEVQNEEEQVDIGEILDFSNKNKEAIVQENEIEKLSKKVKELEERYLRANADFENIKKRMEKEKNQAVSYAHEQFARDLLAVIDSLELGADSLKNKESIDEEMIKKMKEGIDLTIEQFKKVFEKHGIELIDTTGGFNPHFHEAVMQIESEDHKEGEIVQLLQKGYKIKDRILRPAMVSIAK
jgi:molecular chaperone GrpE